MQQFIFILDLLCGRTVSEWNEKMKNAGSSHTRKEKKNLFYGKFYIFLSFFPILNFFLHLS